MEGISNSNTMYVNSNIMYGNNMNSSQVIVLYGMASFNFSTNNIIDFNYMVSVDNISNTIDC